MIEFTDIDSATEVAHKNCLKVPKQSFRNTLKN